MKYPNIMRVLKLLVIFILIIVVAGYSFYHFLLQPHSLSEAASIPSFYPHLEWKLVSQKNLDYPSDFSQETYTLPSKTLYATDNDPSTAHSLLIYYDNALSEAGWYKMDKKYYEDENVIGYYSKLPYKNIQSKFAYIPKERRFFRISTSFNTATQRYEYIIEYNTVTSQ